MINLKKLICPHCGDAFTRTENTLKCSLGHSFDISSDGYVNLLTGHKGGDSMGDNKEMARSRQSFLEKGYYACLRDALRSQLLSVIKKGTVCDCGCGEGYYLNGLTCNEELDLYGFDISKNMLRLASKRKFPATLFVAGVNKIPVKDGSFDGLISVFAPIDSAEFARILKSDGILLCVTAGRHHLWGLKEVLYDKPYENDEDFKVPDGFIQTKTVRVQESVTLTSKQDISSLFAMTPYYYRTPYEAKQRFLKLDSLTTELDFVIRILRKTDTE